MNFKFFWFTKCNRNHSHNITVFIKKNRTPKKNTSLKSTTFLTTMVTPSGPLSDYLPPMNLVGMSARIRSKSGTRFLADRTTLRPSPLVYGKISGRNPSSLLVLVVKGYRTIRCGGFK